MSTATVTGLQTGTWDIDATHSVVGFNVRHMMVSKVRGRFADFSGSVTVEDDFAKSTATGSIKSGSIDTNNADRDAHLRTNDFFDAENHPTIDFVATGVRGGDTVLGDLTIRGTTHPIELDLEITGVGVDAYGKTRAGLSLTGSFNRKDYNVSWNNALDGGGVVVGDKVGIELDLAVVLRD